MKGVTVILISIISFSSFPCTLQSGPVLLLHMLLLFGNRIISNLQKVS